MVGGLLPSPQLNSNHLLAHPPLPPNCWGGRAFNWWWWGGVGVDIALWLAPPPSK